VAKKKTIAKLLDDNAVLLQKLVRMKAADSEGYITCITCEAKVHWKKADGAHFISRKYGHTKDCEENVHASCKQCNGWPDNYTYENYDSYMVAMYGREFINELKILSKIPKKRYRSELLEEKEELKRRVAELGKTL
jgi:hypothetical protein